MTSVLSSRPSLTWAELPPMGNLLVDHLGSNAHGFLEGHFSRNLIWTQFQLWGASTKMGREIKIGELTQSLCLAKLQTLLMRTMCTEILRYAFVENLHIHIITYFTDADDQDWTSLALSLEPQEDLGWGVLNRSRFDQFDWFVRETAWAQPIRMQYSILGQMQQTGTLVL